MSALLSLASGVVGGLGSLLAANQNKQAVRSTNATNLQIARETNQANADMYREQFANQKELQQMQNEWNSAPEEVMRLKQAGLNPALAYGSSSSAAPVSVPSAAPAQGATMQPPLTNYSDSWFNQAMQGVTQALASTKLFHEGNEVKASSQYKAALLENELAQGKQAIDESIERVLNSRQDRQNKSEELLNLRSNRRHLDLMTEILSGQKSELVKSTELQNQQMSAAIELARKQAQYVHEQSLTENVSRLLSIEQNSREWQALNQSVRESMARIGLIGSEHKLNTANYAKAAQEMLGVMMNNSLLRQTFQHNKAILPTIEHQIVQALRQQRQDYNNPFRYIGAALGGTAPAVIGAMAK